MSNQNECLSQPNTSGLFSWQKVKVKKLVRPSKPGEEKAFSLGYPRNFVGMSRTRGGVQKVYVQNCSDLSARNKHNHV